MLHKVVLHEVNKTITILTTNNTRNIVLITQQNGNSQQEKKSTTSTTTYPIYNRPYLVKKCFER